MGSNVCPVPPAHVVWGALGFLRTLYGR
jgi:hypothetical protein